jgi:hypothetical protein
MTWNPVAKIFDLAGSFDRASEESAKWSGKGGIYGHQNGMMLDVIVNILVLLIAG